MLRSEFSKEASFDYITIWEYIAKDNLFYANEVLNKIDSSIETILDFPFIWKEIENWLRIIIEPIYKYKIVYEVRKEIIYIVSIFKYKNLWE
jgi:plasmid stabilization system protein ParE